MAEADRTAELEAKVAALMQALEDEKKKSAEVKESLDESKDEESDENGSEDLMDISPSGLEEVLKESPRVRSARLARPMYVAPTRKIDRFRRRPTSAAEITIQEWVADVKSQISVRQLDEQQSVDFIIDNLAGQARQEILGRNLKNAEDILKILLRIFGDGQSLPQLQQKFYSYRQGENEDLLGCSLELVHLYERISKLDVSFVARRETALKGRLAEAVKDEALRRELRRLNVESPKLSFFEARDRSIEWLGSSEQASRRKPKEVSSQEVRGDGLGTEILDALRKQTDQIARQQVQIDSLLATAAQEKERREAFKSTPRKCFSCGSLHHLRYLCPNRNQRQGQFTNTNHVTRAAPTRNPSPCTGSASTSLGN